MVERQVYHNKNIFAESYAWKTHEIYMETVNACHGMRNNNFLVFVFLNPRGKILFKKETKHI